MKLELDKMTDVDLASLISAAMAEWALRRPHVADTEVITRVPAKPKSIVVHEPSEAEKDFVLRLKTKIKSGTYVKASERQAAAEITARYPAWAKLQKLPTTPSAGDWKRAAAYYGFTAASEK
ncbi:hypothetical protein JN531_012345 [Flagellatimonas centrodinii]|uniref:hypothetical protein n=1 Tax=Flagellatimonas centrodinii TaxID=2806210 RepID=UPI001FEE987A|nr:hypothetical protein [Flagellatimonas centrodinii]ULQ45890.1 hypothetical protein JN531_012345 [Flagellatimonas centrodinii]